MPELSDQLTSALSDRYAIDRQIGAGGMATVFLARDLKHDRQVALKVLNPDLGAVLGVERFLAEIKVTANLQHPNLLPLFDSGEAVGAGSYGSGLLFYVMPYVEGESLRARLEREKQLPVDEALRIGTAVASALDYAHRRGVIHRDLKPENILMHDGQPLVADFGIALAVSNAGGNRITQTGLSLGTPAYMSPEQATGDRVIDARTDIYSLGAVVYEMLTGDPPHVGSTAQAVIARVLTEKPRNIRATRAAVPDHVEHAVERALEKLPADRWATAGQFADGLNGKMAASPSAAATAARPTARARLRDPVVLGLSAAVLLAGVFGAWQWTASHREPVEQTVRFPFVMGANERDLPVSPLAVSPDGSTIVYGASSAGQSLLLVRGLDQLTSRPLPGTDGGAQVTFSPDGEWIAFAAQGQLKKIQISGGAVITLASPLGTISGLTWPRPELIVLSMNDRLMTLPATGGTPKALTQDDSASGEHGQRGPKAIGDDNWVAYNSWRGSLNESRLALVSLETGETEVLDILGAAPIGLLDGQMLYGSVSGSIMAVPFDVRTRKPTGAPVPVIDQYQMPLTGATRASLSRTGTLVYRTGTSTNQVVLADMRGAPKPLIADPKGYSFPRFSPDGKRLAISVTTLGLTDVWIYDIASGTPTRLTNGGTQNERPEWSPDGKRVFFQSNRTGRAALWAQSSDFSGEAQLIESVADGQVPEAVVSPDGAFVLFRSTGGGKQQDLTYRRLTGDTTRKPFVTSPFNDYGPRFSPDGKWVAYMSNQDGANQIYVQGFPEGARHKVTAAGGTAPVWSPDGKRIYYQSDNRLWVATVTTSPSFAVTSRDSLLEGNYELTVPVHANYDVTPDGKNFVLLRRSSSDNPIIVVTGWRRELRARTTVKR